MGSLLNYANEKKDAQGNQLSWGRAGDDGVPFRGPPKMFKSDEEYENSVSRVCDFKARRFDTLVASEFQDYQEVMERVANKWYKLYYIRRLYGPKKNFNYLEWGEFFMQAGPMTRTPVAAPQQVQMPGSDQYGGVPQIG
jgi:hypothetical protein